MALLTTVLGTEKNYLSAMMKGHNEYLVPSPPWAETALPNEELTLTSHQLKTQPCTKDERT